LRGIGKRRGEEEEELRGRRGETGY